MSWWLTSSILAFSLEQAAVLRKGQAVRAETAAAGRSHAERKCGKLHRLRFSSWSPVSPFPPKIYGD